MEEPGAQVTFCTTGSHEIVSKPAHTHTDSHTWFVPPFVCPSLPLQTRTTPPPWWASVGPWPPSRAVSLWPASSPASAWLTSAQTTVPPRLPAGGRQRLTADHVTDTSTRILQEYFCESLYLSAGAVLTLNLLRICKKKKSSFAVWDCPAKRKSCCVCPTASCSFTAFNCLDTIKSPGMQTNSLTSWCLSHICTGHIDLSPTGVVLCVPARLSASDPSVDVSRSASCIITAAQAEGALIIS